MPKTDRASVETSPFPTSDQHLSVQLAQSRFLLILFGLLLLFLTATKADGSAYWFTGLCAAGLGTLLVARGRYGTRRPTTRTSKLEGFPRRLTSSLDAVAEPLIILDNRALVVFANGAALASLPNCKENNPVSFAIRAPLVLDAVDRCLKGYGIHTVQYHERVPVERFFEVTVAPIKLAADVPIRESAVMLMRDVTEMQRIQNMRVDFIANASHELRTPLASIIGFIETLQGPAKNDVVARARFLSIMVEQARRMARLVDDLLSLSRIELTQHLAPSGEVEIAGTVQMIMDSLGGLAKERSVELVFARTLDGPAIVRGDRDELLRVFENLIENAIKYGKDGRKVVVTIERVEASPMMAEPSASDVRVSVRDFGQGIAPEHVPRLTERFYRVDVTSSHEQGGTGLGLAIVKHIVNRHRGRLTIESRLGDGSTFAVNLPEKTRDADERSARAK